MYFLLSGKDFDIVRFMIKCKIVCLFWCVFYRFVCYFCEIYVFYSLR